MPQAQWSVNAGGFDWGIHIPHGGGRIKNDQFHFLKKQNLASAVSDVVQDFGLMITPIQHNISVSVLWLRVWFSTQTQLQLSYKAPLLTSSKNQQLTIFDRIDLTVSHIIISSRHRQQWLYFWIFRPPDIVVGGLIILPWILLSSFLSSFFLSFFAF